MSTHVHPTFRALKLLLNLYFTAFFWGYKKLILLHRTNIKCCLHILPRVRVNLFHTL